MLSSTPYRTDPTAKQGQPQGRGAGSRLLAALSDGGGFEPWSRSLLALGPPFSLRPVSKDRGLQRCGRGKITRGFWYPGILGARTGCYFLGCLLSMTLKTEHITQVV